MLLATPWESGADDGASQRAALRYEEGLQAFQRQDLETARKQVQKALLEDPTLIPGHVLLGRIHLEEGAGDQAEQALLIAETLGANRTLTLLPMAKAYLLQGKYAALIDSLEAARNDLGTDPESWVLLGEAYLELGQLPEAERAYAEAARRAPDQASPLFGQARLRLRRGELSQALAMTRDALRLAPDQAGGWRLTGAIQHARGHLEEALTAYGRAMELDPRDPGTRLARITMLIDLERPAEAAELARQSHANAPQDPRFLYLEAVARARAGDAQGALAAVQDALTLLERLPETRLKTHGPSVLLAALISLGLERWEQAYTYLQRYLTLDPDHPGARKLLGALLLTRGDLDQALEIMEPGFWEMPQDPFFQSMLGEIYSRKGQYVKADDLLSRAVNRHPKDPHARLRRVLNNLARGDEASALGDLGVLAGRTDADPGAGMLLAVLRLARREYPEALEVTQNLTKRFPEHLEARNLLGIVQAASGDLPSAQVSFQRALELDPRALPAQINLGRLALLRGDPQEAERWFTRLLDQDATNTRLMTALAETLEQQGRIQEAIQWLERARQGKPDAIDAGLALTDLLIRAGDAQRARQVAQELELAARDAPRVMAAVGRAELALGRKLEAQILLRRLSTDASYDAQALYPIAPLQFAAGDPKGAIWSLRKAIDARPGFLPSWVLLVHYLLADQQLDQAQEQADQLRQQFPREAMGPQLLGDIALHQGQHAQAIGFYQQAQALGPGSPAVVGLARAHLGAGDRVAALKVLQDWLGSHPDDVPGRQAKAEIHLRQGEWTLAKQEYETLLQHAPRNLVALNNLAYLYDRENAPQALEHARQAHALDPRSAPVNDTLGWILVRQGKAAEGLKYLRDASALSGSDPETHYHLGVALHQLGRPQEAARELDKALKSAQTQPWTPDAQALRKQLP